MRNLAPSLEIVEGSALRYAIDHHDIEQRIPYIRSFDVLIQYLVTLAVSDGFRPDDIYNEVSRTHCFASVSREEFNWCMDFITKEGKAWMPAMNTTKCRKKTGCFR